jgi:hypothetical protein
MLMSARAIHVAGNRLLIALKSDTLAIAKAPRQYATGDLSWRDLQARGARRYGEVLADRRSAPHVSSQNN